MDSLLSVIIPSYNSSEFIEECLISILDSTYSNLEIVIVDDCSTDDTVDKIIRLKNKDSRIKLYKNKQNKGPGFCRELGLKYCNGDYIAFVDSDDTVDTNMYLFMINEIEKDNFDIVQCGYNKISTEGNLIKSYNMRYEILDGENCIKSYFSQSNNTQSLWNKIFKRQLFDLIEFPNLFAGEDACILTQLYTKSKKTITVSKCLYNYRTNPKSLCQSSFNLKKLDVLKAGEFMYEYNMKNNEELAIFSIYYICDYCIRLYRFMEKSSFNGDKNLKKYILEYFNKYYSNLDKKNYYYKYFPKKVLFLMYVFNKNIFLASILFNIIDLKNNIRILVK